MYLINHQYYDFCSPSDIDNSNTSDGNKDGCIGHYTGVQKSKTDQIAEKRVHLYYSYKIQRYPFGSCGVHCRNLVDKINTNISKLKNYQTKTYLTPAIQNISQHADIYLKHFQLEFIDFCITHKQKELINHYNRIYTHILLEELEKAYDALCKLSL
jgi:hypothetical protein